MPGKHEPPSVLGTDAERLRQNVGHLCGYVLTDKDTNCHLLASQPRFAGVSSRLISSDGLTD